MIKTLKVKTGVGMGLAIAIIKSFNWTDFSIVDEPTRVRGLGAYHIRQISAGRNFSLLR